MLIDFSDWRLRALMAFSVAVSFLPFSLALAFTMALANGLIIGLSAFLISEVLSLVGAYVYLTLVVKDKENEQQKQRNDP